MYKLGIDLGGTNIAVGVVDKDYNIVGRGVLKTNIPRPAEEIVDDMVKAMNLAIKDAGITIDEIDGFGVGAPGSVQTETGVISYSNNLGFYDTPLGEMLMQRTGKNFYLQNDANAAAYGEFIAGAGRGANNFIAITLGTGVGGGIIIDKKIYSGSNGAGGELGHIVIQMDGKPCTCGRFGCWETYASAKALVQQTKQAMIRYRDSKMWELCGGDIEKAGGKTSFKAKRLGDKAGTMVVNQYIRYVAVGIANVLNTFQPDVICIGGGVSKEGTYLTDPINEYVAGENYARNMEKKTVIKTAQLGNDAGIIGAAYLCELGK